MASQSCPHGREAFVVVQTDEASSRSSGGSGTNSTPPSSLAAAAASSSDNSSQNFVGIYKTLAAANRAAAEMARRKSEDLLTNSTASAIGNGAGVGHSYSNSMSRFLRPGAAASSSSRSSSAPSSSAASTASSASGSDTECDANPLTAAANPVPAVARPRPQLFQTKSPDGRAVCRCSMGEEGGVRLEVRKIEVKTLGMGMGWCFKDDAVGEESSSEPSGF